ncbi:TIGR03087 family PEP-CTERM/XrtA system glycosyltransferase [Candidatus Methylocalor cossyra]
MKEILFLAHRIPYPPDKGDKIRSFHILKYLTESYRVFLGAFVDDREDWRHAAKVRALCAETCLLPLPPLLGKLRSLVGLCNGAPLSVPYYFDRRMATWVEKLMVSRHVGAIVVFSSAMAQYAEKFSSLPRIIDFVDVDSDKWRQYAASKRWPGRWIYRREAERLLRFDRRIARTFDRALFVSQEEAELFARLAPESAARVMAMENGVDSGYFCASAEYPSPYPDDAEVMVFTGAMDYWANVDAVTWFAGEVFPEVRRRRPKAFFYVVGARPVGAVRALGGREGIVVTGKVPDVRPYLKHARLAVAPLRIARGVQNKVLEAMAMGRPVVASPAAMEGIQADPALVGVRVVERAPDWREAVLAFLETGGREGIGNREFVLERHSWEVSLARLGRLLEAV